MRGEGEARGVERWWGRRGGGNMVCRQGLRQENCKSLFRYPRKISRQQPSTCVFASSLPPSLSLSLSTEDNESRSAANVGRAASTSIYKMKALFCLPDWLPGLIISLVFKMGLDSTLGLGAQSTTLVSDVVEGHGELHKEAGVLPYSTSSSLRWHIDCNF